VSTAPGLSLGRLTEPANENRGRGREKKKKLRALWLWTNTGGIPPRSPPEENR